MKIAAGVTTDHNPYRRKRPNGKVAAKPVIYVARDTHPFLCFSALGN